MNIREIARIADVTPGTVSKVLNNYPDVGEATRKHVLEIIEEYQYAPKVSPRRKGKAIPKIGLVTEGVYNPLYSHIEDMLSILIHNSGYLVLGFHDNYHAQDKTEKMTEMIRQLEKEKLSGLIYIGGNFAPVSREVFRQLPCPAIFINTVLPEQEDELTYSSIQVSHFQTAFGQMKSLIDQVRTDEKPDRSGAPKYLHGDLLFYRQQRLWPESASVSGGPAHGGQRNQLVY